MQLRLDERRDGLLYLDPELDRRLQHAAAEQRVSKAEYIRRALGAAVAQSQPPRITAICVGSGPGDVAGDIDRHLAETQFGQS